MIIKEMFLTPNKYSRPQTPLNKVEKIAVHYVGNAGSSAIANRNYFENQKNSGRYVSSHYIVGLKGEIIQCIPLNEWSYCTNQANSYSISIETCHPDWTGRFNDSTYNSLVELCSYLLKKYNLTHNDLIRHFDVTGKVCPKCFVAQSKGGTDDNNLTAWNQFKNDVKTYMENAKIDTTIDTAIKTESTPTTTTSKTLYRVRKSWADSKSQIGAFSTLKNAKSACKEGYSVFDDKGNCVYTYGKVTQQEVIKTEKINVKYRTYSNSKWRSEITNYNTTNDMGYSGVKNIPIRGLAVKVDKGVIKYRVHKKGGNWLGWITAYDINDWNKGVAGTKTADIDGIQIDFSGISGYEARYRVSTVGSNSYLSWVTGIKDYAGIFGKSIDQVQIEIAKTS